MKSLIHGIQITTLSGWLACSLGYITGFRIPQTWQLTFPEKPKAMKVLTELDFTLGSPITEEQSTNTGETLAASSDQTPAPELVTPEVEQAAAPPPMPDIAPSQALPQIPALPTVTRKVAARTATPTTNAPRSNSNSTANANSNTAPTTATTLSFGSGAGRQPAPTYPYQSRRANQQGTVVIEFIVGTDGKVLNAWVKLPSAWPLLNNAALSTVRSRWAFPAGSPRRYSIPIVFRLS